MANLALSVLIVASAFATAFAGAAGEGLLLLQSHAQELSHDAAGKDRGRHLPTVGEVMSGPKSVLQQMSSRVDELEKRLAEEQQRGESMIAREKVEFEHNLTMQRLENRAIGQQNARLGVRIKELKKSNSMLRTNASTLSHLNVELVADLKAMEANISTAKEFITQSLGKSSEMLEEAPELGVLRELEEQDARQQQESAHAQRLQLVGGSHDLSLLETQSESSGPSSAKDPHGLLEMLSSALQDLSLEQNNSEAMLRKQFETEFVAGADRRVALLGEQETLNNTKASEEELQSKLNSAVSHLQRTHSFLAERTRALRAFATKVGSLALPETDETYSLLQVDSQNSHMLPDMKSVLHKPSQSFDLVISHVAELEQRLAEANQQSIVEAQAKKVEYDNTLRELEHNNTVLSRQNKKVYDDIAVLDRAVGKLRKQTQEVAKSNNVLREELKVIHANITLMQEFLQKSLEETNESVSDTPDLQVLAELAAQDQVKHSESSHIRNLAEIMPEKVALLQIGNVEKKKPHDLLGSLSQAMDSLMSEHEGSLQKLKEEFEKEFAVGQQRHDELVSEWMQLNATRAAKTELEHRLSIALAHLEKTGDKLRKRRSSLLGYAGRLASKPTALSSSSVQAVDRSALEQPRKSKTHKSKHSSKAHTPKRADPSLLQVTAEAVEKSTEMQGVESVNPWQQAVSWVKSTGVEDRVPWQQAVTWVKSQWSKVSKEFD